MALPPLYRRVLGDDRFSALPGVLQRFHDAPTGGRARGTIDVTRGPGWLRNLVASLMGLPRSERDAPVVLEVRVEGERERWVRHLQGRRLVTVQWARGDLLMESFGPSFFSSKLEVEGPTPSITDPQGKMHSGFSATTTLDRTAFGIGPKFGAAMLGDEVKLDIELEVVKQ